MLSSSLDKTVRLWSFVKSQPIAVFTASAPVLKAVVVVQASTAIYTCADGMVGELTLFKSIDGIRASDSFLPLEANAPYRAPSPQLEVRGGAGLAFRIPRRNSRSSSSKQSLRHQDSDSSDTVGRVAHMGPSERPRAARLLVHLTSTQFC